VRVLDWWSGMQPRWQSILKHDRARPLVVDAPVVPPRSSVRLCPGLLVLLLSGGQGSIGRSKNLSYRDLSVTDGVEIGGGRRVVHAQEPIPPV